MIGFAYSCPERMGTNHRTAWTPRIFLGTLVLLLLKSLLAAQSPPPPDPAKISCEGYLVPTNGGWGELDNHVLGPKPNGDVYLRCPGDFERKLTFTGDVVSWALFPDGSKLAVLREASKLNEKRPALLREIIDLHSGKVMESRPADESDTLALETTCGTVMLMVIDRFQGKNRAVDLVTGEDFKSRSFDAIRCSTDRKTILRRYRSSSLSGGPLYLDDGLKEHLVSDHAGNFDISPDGQYIVYVEQDNLCALKTQDLGKQPICVHGISAERDRIVVNNEGDVLLTEETGEPCPRLEDVKRLDGKNHPHMHGWACEGIYGWLIWPNTRDNLVKFLALHPQFVPQMIGKELLASQNRLHTASK